MTLWLVGSGVMARSYAAVLGTERGGFEVIGRGDESASVFERETRFQVRRGGVETALSVLAPPAMAIVSVGVMDLAEVTGTLLAAGTRRILVEKPGGLHREELTELESKRAAAGAEVLIAYNRRHYGSVAAARRLIEADGGIEEFRLEFGERVGTIADGGFPRSVLRRWFLANSTHVVDLAFHLCGDPVDIECQVEGALDWHPSAAFFAGRGTCVGGATFTYEADWRMNGSWGLEIQTPVRRLVFRPLERLVVEQGGVEAEVPVTGQLDEEFKPGLMLQVRAFLSGDDRLACSSADQLRRFGVYARMAGYQDDPDW